ncbi:MAG: diaminopimelate decarboxylase family protein, partial [Stellaceae bacterium]
MIDAALPGAPELHYRAGELWLEEVPVRRIAEAVGTPVYAYSSAHLTRRYREFIAAFAGRNAMLCFAVKANSNIAVLRLLTQLGAGADIVSEGELHRALAAGVPADRIVFSGIGKIARELEAALEAHVYQINVESEPELELLSALASRMGK